MGFGANALFIATRRAAGVQSHGDLAPSLVAFEGMGPCAERDHGRLHKLGHPLLPVLVVAADGHAVYRRCDLPQSGSD